MDKNGPLRTMANNLSVALGQDGKIPTTLCHCGFSFKKAISE